jgi:cell division septation protein DedD
MESVPGPDKPVKPAPTANGQTVAASATARDLQKPAASEGRKMYAVQIAAVKDKNTAEELRKTLQKKGFDAAIKITGDPKQGQTYVLQLQPVDDMGKASTLLEQVKYVPQAKPTIITVPAGN